MRHLLLWVLLLGRSGTSTVAQSCGSNAIYQYLVIAATCQCKPGYVCTGSKCGGLGLGTIGGNTWYLGSFQQLGQQFAQIMCWDCECVAGSNGGGGVATTKPPTTTTPVTTTSAIPATSPATCAAASGADLSPQSSGRILCLCPSGTPSCNGGCTEGTFTSGGKAFYWTPGTCSNCKCNSCSTTDYTYAWPSAWTTVNAGCGTGVARQRTEVESCPAPSGCSCKTSSKRDVQTETKDQEPCVPTTSSTTTTTTTTSTTTTTAATTPTTTIAPTFQCKNATYSMCSSKDQCILRKLVCDGGDPDCDDGSDEQGCTIATTTPAGDVDCAEAQDPCTAICETASARNYQVLQMKTRNGRACKGPQDCKPGDGECASNPNPAGASNTNSSSADPETPASRKKPMSPGLAAGIAIITILLVAVGVVAFCRFCKDSRGHDGVKRGRANMQPNTHANPAFAHAGRVNAEGLGEPHGELADQAASSAEYFELDEVLHTVHDGDGDGGGSMGSKMVTYVPPDPNQPAVYDAAKENSGTLETKGNQQPQPKKLRSRNAAPTGLQHNSSGRGSSAGGNGKGGKVPRRNRPQQRSVCNGFEEPDQDVNV